MITKKQWKLFLNQLKYLISYDVCVTFDGMRLYDHNVSVRDEKIYLDHYQNVFKHPDSFNDNTTIEDLCKRVQIIHRFDERLRVIEILSKMPH